MNGLTSLSPGKATKIAGDIGILCKKRQSMKTNISQIKTDVAIRNANASKVARDKILIIKNKGLLWILLTNLGN